MSYPLTEDQLDQIGRVFNLKRKIDTLTIRGGDEIAKGDKVWWRAENGPEYVVADGMHWGNIKNFPNCYQLTKLKMVYSDD